MMTIYTVVATQALEIGRKQLDQLIRLGTTDHLRIGSSVLEAVTAVHRFISENLVKDIALPNQELQRR
jgi:hypothetical protein